MIVDKTCAVFDDTTLIVLGILHIVVPNLETVKTIFGLELTLRRLFKAILSFTIQTCLIMLLNIVNQDIVFPTMKALQRHISQLLTILTNMEGIIIQHFIFA